MALIKGTKANDTLTGVAAGSTIYGLGGNDSITTVQNTVTGTAEAAYGGGGNDTLTGINITGSTAITAGKDRLFGDTGNDSINGNGGNDALYGGAGNDTITMGGNAGHALLFGGIGNDSMVGSGATTAFDTALAAGKYYNQSLSGGDGNDSIFGGAVSAASDKHILKGEAGNDQLTAASGAAGVNYMYGGVGNDTLTGSSVQGAKDYMYGGAGADVFNGGWTDSTHNNALNETVSYVSSAAGVTITLASVGTTATPGTAPTAGVGGDAAGDLIYNVNNAYGSKNADSITGNLTANKIDGGAGADSIYDGGTSASTMSAATATNATNLNTGNDTLLGSGGNDTIYMHNGNGTADSIDGGIGTDTLDFSNVVDNTTAGAGGDISAGANGLQANVAGVSAGGYNQGTVTGVFVNLSNVVAGTNNFEGSAGQGSINGIEKVIGTIANDFLVAGGNSTIDGGAGNDTLVSGNTGGGRDVLIGGAGNDVFDGTATSKQDYYQVGGTVTGGLDSIYGFHGTDLDKVQISMADILDAGGKEWGITAATVTTAAGNVGVVGTVATQVAVSADVNANYTNLGKFVNFTLNGTGGEVVSITGALNTTTVLAGTAAGITTASAHSEFIFNSTTGDLFYANKGSTDNGTVTTGITQLAHIDINTFVGHSGLASTIDSTDFILVA